MNLQQVKVVTGGPKQLAYKLDENKLIIWIGDGLDDAPDDANYVMVLEGNKSWSMVEVP